FRPRPRNSHARRRRSVRPAPRPPVSHEGAVILLPRVDGADLLEHLADAVLLADGDDRIAWMNPAAEEMSGRSAARAAGKPLAELLGADGDIAREARSSGRAIARDGIALAGHPVDA